MGPRLLRLRADQFVIATHPAKSKYIATGRRWGKTTMAGSIAIVGGWGGAQVAWIVPTFRNSNPFWRAAVHSVRHLREARLAAWNNAERVMLFPRNGGRICVFSDVTIDSMRGEHFHIVILDEAARIREESVQEVIVPTLADFDGSMLAFSTPRGKNWFYRGWADGLSRMDGETASWRAPTTDNPMPTIRRAAGLAQRRLPDRVYRQEWEAEFVADAFDTWMEEWYDGQQRYVIGTLAEERKNVVARYLSFDTGLKDKATSAYSACVVGELMSNYNLRVRSVWRDRVTFPNLIPQIERLARTWNDDGKLCGIIIEDVSSGTSAYQTLKLAMTESGIQLIAFQPRGSKEQRGEQAAVWGRNGVVWLPRPSEQFPWLHDFEMELFSFPSCEYKDQSDALHQLILYLEHYLAVAIRPRDTVEIA